MAVLTLNVLYMYYVDHKLLVLFIRATQVVRVRSVRYIASIVLPSSTNNFVRRSFCTILMRRSLHKET